MSAKMKPGSALLFVISTAFVLGISWAFFSELDQVVTAESKIIPYDKLQTVQHYEGGIVDKIFIKNGDSVKAGTALFELNSTESDGSYQIRKNELLSLAAKIKRLEALVSDRSLNFNEAKFKEIPAVIQAERLLYLSYKSQLKSTIEALREQQLQRQVEFETANKQLFLIKEEKILIQKLVEKGLETRIELIKIDKAFNEAEQRSRAAESGIKEINSKIILTKQESQSNLLSDLSKSMTELRQLEKSLPTFANKLDRTILRSPIDGIVNRVLINTVNGVIKSGEPVVEIVPKSNKITFEAQVLPSDIGFVKVGQIASIKMSTFDYAIYGGLSGVVSLVGSDSVTDSRGLNYYLVRIDLVDNRFKSSNKNLELISGMTAQADIITGKRSVLSYLSAPITKTLSTAFKEK